MNDERYTVPAIDNAILILDYLSKKNRSTLSDIYDSVNLNRSTCYRIIQSLTKHNIVSFNPLNKTYKLGHYLIYLGSKASAALNDVSSLQPYLDKVMELTRQTCILTQRYGDDQIIYLSKKESSNDHRINVNIGQLRPVTSTAPGKCFLAYADPRDVERMIQFDGGLKRYTSNTIVEFDEFMNELKKIKEKGYAIGREEFLQGISGVAAPIFGHEQNVQYVLFISCFSAQTSNAELKRFGEILKEITDQMTKDLLNP